MNALNDGLSRAEYRNRRFGRRAPPRPARPERIKLMKGQQRIPPGSSIHPMPRLGRDVATRGYGFVRTVLHDANVRIADYNEAMRRLAAKKRIPFTPRKLIHPTKKGPGRGSW